MLHFVIINFLLSFFLNTKLSSAPFQAELAELAVQYTTVIQFRLFL